MISILYSMKERSPKGNLFRRLSIAILFRMQYIKREYGQEGMMPDSYLVLVQNN